MADFTPLDPGLYSIPYAAVFARIAGTTGKFANLGDVDEFKLSITAQRKVRYARNRSVRVKAIDVPDQIDTAVSFKIMQFSTYARTMQLLGGDPIPDAQTGSYTLAADGIAFAETTAPAPIVDGELDGDEDTIEIAKQAQVELEIILIMVGSTGPKGTLHLYRVQCSPDGDQMFVGSDDFVGTSFKGSAIITTQGIGYWRPYKAAA